MYGTASELSGVVFLWGHFLLNFFPLQFELLLFQDDFRYTNDIHFYFDGGFSHDK